MIVFFRIIQVIFYIASAYIGLSVGCEYRRGGHFLIKAFYAKTPYQTLFTLMQLPKDIEGKDLGKLTYIGYIGVILSTIGILFLIPYSIYQYHLSISFALFYRIKTWSTLSFLWGIFSQMLQMIDSILNWIINKIFPK